MSRTATGSSELMEGGAQVHYLPAEGPAGTMCWQRKCESVGDVLPHPVCGAPRSCRNTATSMLTPQSSLAQLLWDVLEKLSQHPSDCQRSEGSLWVRCSVLKQMEGVKSFRAVMSDTVVTEAESFIYDCESCDDGDVNGLQSSVHIKIFRRTSASLLRWRSVTFDLCDMSKVPNSSRVVAV